MIPKKHFAILGQLCGNFCEAGKAIEEIRGPRGGLKGYKAGSVRISPTIRNRMVGLCLLDDQNQLTELGFLAYQDWLADQK